jgi:hypothetical protein
MVDSTIQLNSADLRLSNTTTTDATAATHASKSETQPEGGFCFHYDLAAMYGVHLQKVESCSTCSGRSRARKLRDLLPPAPACSRLLWAIRATIDLLPTCSKQSEQSSICFSLTLSNQSNHMTCSRLLWTIKVITLPALVYSEQSEQSNYNFALSAGSVLMKFID